MGFIYQIRNTVNGKCYVGQTKRDDPQKRWKEHKRKPNNPYIKFAFELYGVQSFIFEVLFEAQNDELDDLEIKEIATRNTLAPNGYNLQEGGNCYGLHTEESKKKISDAQRGQKRPKTKKPPPRTEETRRKLSEKNKNKRPINQYTLEGVLVKTFPSISNAKAETGIRGVGKCASGEIRQSGGFVWRFVDTPDVEYKPLKPKKEKRKANLKRYYEKIKELATSPYAVFDNYGRALVKDTEEILKLRTERKES
jgi:group I intron endonuclease